MGFGDRLKEFIAPEEDEEQLELTKEEAEAVSPYEKSTLPGSAAITANTNIVLFEPRNFDEAEEIGHHIKSKRACCVNLHRMPPNTARGSLTSSPASSMASTVRSRRSEKTSFCVRRRICRSAATST